MRNGIKNLGNRIPRLSISKSINIFCIFFHPDYTVGLGIQPSHALRLVGYTTGRDLHPALKHILNFTRTLQHRFRTMAIVFLEGIILCFQITRYILFQRPSEGKDVKLSFCLLKLLQAILSFSYLPEFFCVERAQLKASASDDFQTVKLVLLDFLKNIGCIFFL